MNENKEKAFHLNADIVLLACAIFFGGMTIAFWFLQVIEFNYSTFGAVPSNLNGFTLAFGGICNVTVMSPGTPVKEIPIYPTPMILITFLLEVTGFVALVGAFFVKHFLGKNKLWKALIIYATSVYLLAGVLSFFLSDFFWNSAQEQQMLDFKGLLVEDYTSAPFYAIMAFTSAFIASLQFFYFKREAIVNQSSL